VAFIIPEIATEMDTLKIEDLYSKEMLEEAQELIRELEAAGFKPQLCDTLVPVCNFSVKCGVPTEPGDEDRSEFISFPKSLVGLHPELIFPVQGDSMKDAGLEEGDEIRIRIGAVPRDGDTVLACIDGQYTVKAFFTYEDGTTWLVPRNDNYDAILLREDMDVRFKGVVVGVLKTAPRCSNRDLSKAIRRAKKKLAELPAPAVKSLPESVTPVLPKPEIPTVNTCFFILGNGHTYQNCMDKLDSMLQSSTMQSRVLRKLFGPEGREWFDLYERDTDEVEQLLNQFSAKCGEFTWHSIRKILADIRPVLEQEKLDRLNGKSKTT